jgi:hypothetical protein
LKPNSTFTRRIRIKQGVSQSNLITSIVVGGFVVLVVAGLVLAYLTPTPNESTSTTAQALFFSGLSLLSGSGSSNSLNATCSGDSQLELSVTNSAPNTIYMTNVTMSESHSTNATTLVPLSNGCIPVSENNPPIASGSNDFQILTYPSVPVPPYTSWNVTIYFSDGQTLSQLSISSPLAPE